MTSAHVTIIARKSRSTARPITIFDVYVAGRLYADALPISQARICLVKRLSVREHEAETMLTAARRAA